MSEYKCSNQPSRDSLACERGFSLIELLATMFVLAVLAAIALPVFLGQTRKADDAQAKSAARNAMSLLESCYVERVDYGACASSIFSGSGLRLGSGENEVALSELGVHDYKITVLSTSGTPFTITKKDHGPRTLSW